MPPPQNTAANGILPTEQTKDMAATRGPIILPQMELIIVELCIKKSDCQKEFGTKTPKAPAISNPATTSFHTESTSIKKKSGHINPLFLLMFVEKLIT